MATEASSGCRLLEQLETQKKLIVLLHKLPADISTYHLNSTPSDLCSSNGEEQAKCTEQRLKEVTENSTDLLHPAPYEVSHLASEWMDRSEICHEDKKDNEKCQLKNQDQTKLGEYRNKLTNASDDISRGTQKHGTYAMQNKSNLVQRSDQCPDHEQHFTIFNLDAKRGMLNLKESKRTSRGSESTHKPAPFSKTARSTRTLNEGENTEQESANRGNKPKVHETPGKMAIKRCQGPERKEIFSSESTYLATGSLERCEDVNRSEIVTMQHGSKTHNGTETTCEKRICTHAVWPRKALQEFRGNAARSTKRKRPHACDTGCTMHDSYKKEIQPTEPQLSPLSQSSSMLCPDFLLKNSEENTRFKELSVSVNSKLDLCTRSQMLKHIPFVKDQDRLQTKLLQSESKTHNLDSNCTSKTYNPSEILGPLDRTEVSQFPDPDSDGRAGLEGRPVGNAAGHIHINPDTSVCSKGSRLTDQTGRHKVRKRSGDSDAGHFNRPVQHSGATEIVSEVDIPITHTKEKDIERTKTIHFRTIKGDRFAVEPKSLIVSVSNMDASERVVLKLANPDTGKKLTLGLQSMLNNESNIPRDVVRPPTGRRNTNRQLKAMDGCWNSQQSPTLHSGTWSNLCAFSGDNKKKKGIPYTGKRECTCDMSYTHQETSIVKKKCSLAHSEEEDSCCFHRQSTQSSDLQLNKNRRSVRKHQASSVLKIPHSLDSLILAKNSTSEKAEAHTNKGKPREVGKVCRNYNLFRYRNCEKQCGTETLRVPHRKRKSRKHINKTSDVYSQMKLFKYTIGRISSKNLVYYKQLKKKRALWISHSCSKCGKMFYTRIFIRPILSNVELKQQPKHCSKNRNEMCLPCQKIKTKVQTDAKESYVCTECGKRFVLHAVLVLHQRSHAEEKLFVCFVCGKRFVQHSLLLIHQKTHLGRKPHKCVDCGQIFYVKELFAAHQRTHRAKKPHRCVNCGKCFADKSTLLIHQRIHTGEKPFSCPDCEKSFSQHSTLISHQRIHTGEKPFTCHECGRQFGDRSAFASHRRTHTGEKPFKCDACGKTFAQSSNLRRHERIHK
ncbi:uncharacterized protein LOC134578387 [Pelobates fuscus]|uniref:uncharacterized protein LOC134578387 n=1 Tax=Pelobates fuscus TaxID=191477 RepID=UPI002FE4937C